MCTRDFVDVGIDYTVQFILDKEKLNYYRHDDGKGVSIPYVTNELTTPTVLCEDAEKLPQEVIQILRRNGLKVVDMQKEAM